MQEEEANGRIRDPAADFIEARREELADFVFRLTADPGRAEIMARETCVQIKDELPSQASFEMIRRLLFQRAYDLNEDALRPPDRRFFEQYYRHHYTERQQLALVYRWEIMLLEIGHMAALVLLLIHRFGFSEEDTAEILGRDLQDIKNERETLEKRLKKQKKGDWDSLRKLPRYGFIATMGETETPISAMMRDMKQRHLGPTWSGRRVFLGLLLGALGIFLVMFLAVGLKRGKGRKKSRPSTSRPPSP